MKPLGVMRMAFTSLLILMTLTACGKTSDLVDKTASSELRPTWDEYLASLESDDQGPYKILAGEWIESENGFLLGIEARQYVLDGTARFVTVHRDLEERAEPAGGMALKLVVEDDVGSQLYVDSMYVPADKSTRALGSIGVLFAPVPAVMGVQLDGGPPSQCATLVVDYSSDSYFDRVLTTCRNHR